MNQLHVLFLSIQLPVQNVKSFLITPLTDFLIPPDLHIPPVHSSTQLFTLNLLVALQ